MINKFTKVYIKDNLLFWVIAIPAAVIIIFSGNKGRAEITIFSFVLIVGYSLVAYFVGKNHYNHKRFLEKTGARQELLARLDWVGDKTIRAWCLINSEDKKIFEEKNFDKMPFILDLEDGSLKVGDVIVMTITKGPQQYGFFYNKASKKQKFRFNFYNKNSRG